jgi:anti-sigma regulatory factor (Ser/Thr protein kinase)
MRTWLSGPQSRLRVEDPSQVGECRRTALRLAESHGFAEPLAGRVAIVATELGNNLIRHVGHGELLLQALTDGSDVSIELIAVDRGPGMDVAVCLRDGHSTAGTAGTGLGAISRLSTLFDVYSLAGRGTVVVSRIADKAGASSPQFGAVCVAVAGEIECGDTWRIAERSGATAILVADGLGHGPLAATASRAAAVAFGERPFDSPSETMLRVHGALSGGRGAAAACATLNSRDQRVIYAGVGNIAGRLLTAERSRGMVSHNGTLGVQLLRRQDFEYDYPAASRVVMHSDGISARWSIDSYPGLGAHHAAVMAAVLYRDHGRDRDDVTIVVSGSRS